MTLFRTLPRVLFIDGRSGSGKTSLADELAVRHGAQRLQLDDLYPGWLGLGRGSASVATALRSGAYRRYDWAAADFAETVSLVPGRSLIVEGCGSLTKDNLDAALMWAAQYHTANTTQPMVASVWLEAAPELRKARALARDGESFAAHWQQWAEQEDAHYQLHAPWLLADEIVNVE